MHDTRAVASVRWLNTYSAHCHDRLARTVKRALDIDVAAVLLILLFPVLVILAIAVRLSSQGPVFFVQRRIGYLAGEFNLIKFRTMIDHAEEMEDALARENGGRYFKLKDDPRVTRLGRFMRKYSLDELPQIAQVFIGQMSLVGPRPLLQSDFEHFPKWSQLRRFAMKPGLTGLWQISGRSRLTDYDRLRLDLEYVDNWSLSRDFRIVLSTPLTVLKGDGAW